MLTNCLAECAHLTITVSQIERDIGRKSSFFHTALHSMPPLGGSRRNSAIPFSKEKLEWLGYQMVKKFEDIFIRFGVTHERDRQTDGQTDTTCRHIPRLCIASRGKNVVKIAIFGLTHRLKHRITRKLLKIDRYMLREVWQPLNCLSIHETYCVIIAAASPGETNVGCGT